MPTTLKRTGLWCAEFMWRNEFLCRRYGDTLEIMIQTM